MLGALYLVGVPLFGFLAWVFSEAVHVGELDDRHSRRLLVGAAQMLGVWILASLSQARRLDG